MIDTTEHKCTVLMKKLEQMLDDYEYEFDTDAILTIREAIEYVWMYKGLCK